MRKFLVLFALALCACSDNSTDPGVGEWSRGDLIGEWYGQLPQLVVTPDTTIPFWAERYRFNPLYNRQYDFRGLEVYFNILENSFLINLQYNSDSLIFHYTERGRWELTGQPPEAILMDSTSTFGIIETRERTVGWQSGGCCWRADVSLETGDPTSSGFDSGILKIFNIESRMEITDLVLEK